MGAGRTLAEFQKEFPDEISDTRAPSDDLAWRIATRCSHDCAALDAPRIDARTESPCAPDGGDRILSEVMTGLPRGRSRRLRLYGLGSATSSGRSPPLALPCRKFQPTICSRPIQRAAKNDVISLNDGPMNVNSEPEPRMMPIKDLA